MSVRVRPPAVAGYFYPRDAERLARSVAALMKDVPAAGTDGHPSPKAIIAPHAGYRYSGSVAATAYATLAAARGIARRVILAGPAHRSPVDGVAASSADAFATPLGPVEVDGEARHVALGVAGAVIDDRAHAGEHSLEVHLPFLLGVLGDVKVLPLLVGQPGAAVFAEVLDVLWGGHETLIVVSTDLSHYHDHDTARTIDGGTAEAICRLEPPRPEDACGAATVEGLLLAGRRHQLDVRLLDLRTSADTVGDPDRVVGYGAFALT